MKAILYNKNTGEIAEIIENIQDYNDNDICGKTHIMGLSPHISWIMLDDNIEVNCKNIADLKNYKDHKPDQDLKKQKQAEIQQLKQELNNMDYIINQRNREEQLVKVGVINKTSKTDQEYLAKLQEMQSKVSRINKLESEISKL